MSGLVEAAYREEHFPALRLARSSRTARRIAKALFAVLIVSIVAMLSVPWQQSVTGSGNVVAYAPLDRQQVVQAPIKGRIVRWREGIRENALVAKGQEIVEIQDLDPNLLARLEDQQKALQRQLEAAQEQADAHLRQRDAADTVVEAYTAQVEAFRSVKEQIVAAADEYVKMAEQKLRAEQENQLAAQAALAQAEADFQRQKALHEDGLVSQLKMQLAERKYKEAAAKANQASAYVASAENELQAKKNERGAKEREVQTKIDSSEATLRKARAEVAKAESDRAKALAEVTKAEKELLDIEVKISRQQSQVVVAPRDGFVMQLLANQGGAIVKAGDPLFVLVPDTSDRAVQIWVDGNDAPLIEPGRHVRLQFEGWPAVQFAGWPSVAVGTFGGTVATVDATDNGKGKFRVLIVPDSADQSWPSGRFLRQGVRANGWVLLNQVSLGYEIWRRLNGFPPVVSMDEPEKDVSGIKIKRK